MKERQRMWAPAIGGCSLLVIFGVLCLVILALVSLNTVLAEQRLSETSARAASDWYAADLEAQKIFASLRAGEPVSGMTRRGTEYAYSVPISGRQTLEVTLKETDGCWEVLFWQAKAWPENGPTTLPVWQGSE